LAFIAFDQSSLRIGSYRSVSFPILQYLISRTNVGLARVAGMGTELKMTGNNSYSIALLVFFIGYLLFDLPSNLIIRRAGPANWLAFIVTCWGATTLGTGFVRSWEMLAVARVFLGIFEVYPNSLLANVRRGYFPAAYILSVVGTNDMKFKHGSPSFTCAVFCFQDYRFIPRSSDAHW
jgi:MFS family permease